MTVGETVLDRDGKLVVKVDLLVTGDFVIVGEPLPLLDAIELLETDNVALTVTVGDRELSAVILDVVVREERGVRVRQADDDPVLLLAIEMVSVTLGLVVRVPPTRLTVAFAEADGDSDAVLLRFANKEARGEVVTDGVALVFLDVTPDRELVPLRVATLLGRTASLTKPRLYPPPPIALF